LHYSEFGLKNKRRIMEDKTAIFENIDLFCNNNKEISFKKRSNSLFGVFDGFVIIINLFYLFLKFNFKF
jgi:hypothetical protein